MIVVIYGTYSVSYHTCSSVLLYPEIYISFASDGEARKTNEISSTNEIINRLDSTGGVCGFAKIWCGGSARRHMEAIPYVQKVGRESKTHGTVSYWLTVNSRSIRFLFHMSNQTSGVLIGRSDESAEFRESSTNILSHKTLDFILLRLCHNKTKSTAAVDLNTTSRPFFSPPACLLLFFFFLPNLSRTMMLTPPSPIFDGSNLLTMTILVNPPPLEMTSFDWSDFPIVQRDSIENLSSCFDGEMQIGDRKNQGNDQEEEQESLPDQYSICSCDSSLSVATITEPTKDSSSSSSSSSSSTDVKRVTFAEHVHVQRHGLVVGDHPCCSQLALELSWEHDDGQWEPLMNEEVGIHRRRHTNTRRRSYFERKNLLKSVGGMTDDEIRQTTLKHAAPSSRDLSAMQGIVI